MAGTLESLLHFDGANGSTVIADATGKHTWTANGGTQLTTANSKFGPSSISASWISGDGTINWGTSDWTVDCWIYYGAGNVGFRGDIFYHNSVSTLYFETDGRLNFYSNGAAIAGGTVLTTNAWHHIALTKSGSNHYMFLDGQQQGSTWVSATNYGVAGAGYPQIQSLGYYFDPGSYQDELRIVIGSAEWTSNFTPPTTPYPDPGSTYTLTATLGTFALTGIAAGTLYGRTLQQTTVGNFTLTGIASGSSRTYLVISTTGSFAFNGIATGLLKGDVLSMATGTFALTGITANLIYSAGLNSYVMSATPTAFVFTGINANLVYYQLVNYVLVCGTGQFYFTGLGVGSPGQGLLSGSGLGTPVVTIPFGGAPIIDVTYLGLKAGAPVSEAAPGEGIPVTKVLTGGTPVVYI